MSKLAQPNGEDYPDAAGKHLVDSHLLFQVGRFDGAGYLTGYVVECVLKTYILIDRNKPQFGHNLNGLSQSALRLAAMPNAKTAKYPLTMTTGHSMYDSQKGWKVELRYKATHITAQQARDWLAEARAVYAAAIPQMKADGLI